MEQILEHYKTWLIAARDAKQASSSSLGEESAGEKREQALSALFPLAVEQFFDGGDGSRALGVASRSRASTAFEQILNLIRITIPDRRGG